MERFEKRGNFEQAFSMAFESAEITPGIHVWEKIDTILAKDQNSSFRKRLFFFQLVAAASLIFAATITLYQVFKTEDQTTAKKSLTEQTPDFENQKPSDDLNDKQQLAETSETIEKSNTGKAVAETERNQDIKPKIAQANNWQRHPVGSAIVVDEQKNTGIEMPFLSNIPSAPDVELISVEPSGADVITGLVEYKPLFIPAWTKKKIKESKSDMWASAGFTAGSYNPSSGFGLSMFSADEAAYADQLGSNAEQSVFSDEQKGRTVGGGIGFGTRLGEKWVLESGLNYLHSEIDGTTNSYIESNGKNYPVYYDTRFAGPLSNVKSFGSTSLAGVTNSLDFISLPMKAGYVLINKKIGWVAMGGIGSNILLGNTLKSDLNELEQVRYSVADSPYRRMSWSGIIGTEVYFNITEDYQLMIVPQYTFGITEITKQESSFSIVPNSFNLGLRFRYLLK